MSPESFLIRVILNPHYKLIGILKVGLGLSFFNHKSAVQVVVGVYFLQ